jgi:hypothetical protein
MRTNPSVSGRRTVGAASPKKIPVVDIGGSKIKVLATGESKPRKVPDRDTRRYRDTAGFKILLERY